MEKKLPITSYHSNDEQKIVFFPTIKFVDPLFDALSSGNIHFSHTFHIL